jgi:hypothetical protein
VLSNSLQVLEPNNGLLGEPSKPSQKALQELWGGGGGGNMVTMNSHTETVAEIENYTCHLHKVTGNKPSTMKIFSLKIISIKVRICFTSSAMGFHR